MGRLILYQLLSHVFELDLRGFLRDEGVRLEEYQGENSEQHILIGFKKEVVIINVQHMEELSGAEVHGRALPDDDHLRNPKRLHLQDIPQTIRVLAIIS